MSEGKNAHNNRRGSHISSLEMPKTVSDICTVNTDVLCGFSNLIRQTGYTQRITWLTSEIIHRAGESGTYNFDAVPWSGGQCPGAWLLTRVFIWPVGAGDDTTHTIHSVITASCKNTWFNWHRSHYNHTTEQHNAKIALKDCIWHMCSLTLMAVLITKE